MANKETKGTQTTAVVGDLPQAPEPKATEYLSAYKNWAYAAISYRATVESQTEIKLFKRTVRKNDEDQIEEMPDHEANVVLHHVNDFTTFNQLRQLNSTYRDLMGEAAWCLIRDTGGTPIEIWALRPDWLKIVPSSKEYVDHYVYAPGGGAKEVTLKREDVIFFKDVSPTNPYRGFGIVRPSAFPLDIDEFADKYNRNFFFNNAMPTFMLTTDREMSAEDAQRLVESFRQNYGGVKQTHKMGVLAGGKWDVKDISKGMQEIGYLESKNQLRDQILSMFKVSKANIGIVEDVNRANQEASDARFAKDVVKPNLVSFVTTLNEFYLDNWPDEGLFFDFEDPVPEDMKLKLEIYNSGLTHGWLLRNEVRADEGREPVEGGDDMYVPVNVQPLGETEPEEGAIKSLFKKKKAIEKTPRKIDKRRKYVMPRKVKSLKELRKDKVKKAIKGDFIQLIGEVMREKERVGYYDKEGKIHVWKELVAETDIKEAVLSGLMDELSVAQQKEVNEKLNKHSSALTKTKGTVYKVRPTSLLFGLTAEVKKWTAVLMPFLAKFLDDRGEKVLAGFGQPGKFDPTDEAVVAYLTGLGQEFVQEINETTRKDLIKVLSEGIAANESPDDLSLRIAGVYEKFRGVRSLSIARTETLRTANFATQEAYVQSGVVVGKEWLTAEDERTCPWCNSLNGKIIDVQTDFFSKGDPDLVVDGRKLSFEYGDVPTPPLHPNCRCTTIPVTLSQTRAAELDKMETKSDQINSIAEEVQARLDKKYVEDLEGKVQKSQDNVKEVSKQKKEIEKIAKKVTKDLETQKAEAEEQLKLEQSVSKDKGNQVDKLKKRFTKLQSKVKSYITNGRSEDK